MVFGGVADGAYRLSGSIPVHGDGQQGRGRKFYVGLQLRDTDDLCGSPGKMGAVRKAGIQKRTSDGTFPQDRIFHRFRFDTWMAPVLRGIFLYELT